MTYTAEDILEENYGDDVSVIQDGTLVGTWRWGTSHQTVVKIGEDFYAVDFRSQPEQGIQSHSDMYRVVPHERVTIEIEYVRMEECGR